MTPQDFLNKKVTVLDTSNYKAEYCKDEDYPMVAVLYEITDYPCYWVRSVKTGHEYELYSPQIQELVDL